MEKKVTLRFHLEREEERRAYQNILGRDLKRFRTITDYVCAAVLTYEKNTKKRGGWIQALLEALEEKGYLKLERKKNSR